MVCRSCGVELSPGAKRCPSCGSSVPRIQQLPPRRRKALHGVIAGVAALLVIAGVLLWYFITTDRETNNDVKDAITDMRFSDAEARMDDVHIFQPGDLALRRELIAAGHEAENRNHVAVLQRLSAIREQYDAATLAPYRGVIDQLEVAAEPDLYVSLCTDYDAGKYESVLEGFETLADRGYERSRDYLFLTRAHIAADLKALAAATDMSETDAEQKLLHLIGFADAGKLVFADDSYAMPYLEGYWESIDGSLYVEGSRVTCSLPGIELEQACSIHDGAIYLNSDPDTPVYTFEVFNANTLICDRVEDGINCTLRKQS